MPSARAPLKWIVKFFTSWVSQGNRRYHDETLENCLLHPAMVAEALLPDEKRLPGSPAAFYENQNRGSVIVLLEHPLEHLQGHRVASWAYLASRLRKVLEHLGF